MPTVLVYGATGDQGLPLMRGLLGAGLTLRAATRDPSHFPKSEFPSVTPVAASFSDRGSLYEASRGVDMIAMNLPFTFNRDEAAMMGENICAAAKDAGVKKIVFNTSCVIAPTDVGLSAHDGRRDIEASMEASGLEFAVIRSAVFMDNMIRPWVKPSIVNHDIYPYPASDDLKISFISIEDVAAYMVAALMSPHATAHRFSVGGPEALTGHEAAERVSIAAGRKIRFQPLKPEEFARGVAKLVTGSEEVTPGSIWEGMAEFYQWYNEQPQSPVDIDLRPALKVLPVRPTPLLVWAMGQDWSRI
ncbi:MAG: NAD(P)H-binding protein [Alphaproteobacteria bacterium]|nr:NAD(P)H-binding protein [Alphaproteobacteria bacterium]